MTGPKHLWSGDWEEESDAAARRRGRTALPELPDEPAPAPEAPTRRHEPEPAARREPLHVPWRAVLIAVATALVVIGVALAGNAIFNGGKSTPGAVKPGWLGVRLGVVPSGAVVVTGVDSGSPASSAGLRAGDVITEVQGRPVAAPVDVALAVDALGEGDELEIGALRGSHAYTTQVRLAARPAGASNRAGP